MFQLNFLFFIILNFHFMRPFFWNNSSFSELTHTFLGNGEMAAFDYLNTYTVTANRSYSNGTQNRITIFTSGSYLKLLFGSGPRAATSIASLIGFPGSDQSGGTTYTGTQSAGTLLVPTWYAYNYIDLNQYKQVFGNLNISATGQKEAIVFQIQQFFEMEFKYESASMVLNAWSPFMTWAIQQKAFDFTPDITNANTVYNATLESTDEDSKGLGFKFTEMLPEFPFLYSTGALKLRLKVGS